MPGFFLIRHHWCFFEQFFVIIIIYDSFCAEGFFSFRLINKKMEQTMSNKMKVVCPKCQAKLQFDPAKINSDVVKFKCPACAVVLRIKKPAPERGKEAGFIRHVKKTATADQHERTGAELSDMAQKFKQELGVGQEDRESKTGMAGSQDTSVLKDEPESSENFIDETLNVSETRREKRVKFKKKVLVNNQIMVEALDISEGGLFLHTGRSFEDGAIVDVGIPTQPGSFDLIVQAKVRHNHRGIGMGLQFVDVDVKKKMQLKKLVNELDEAAAKELEGRKKILLIGGTDTARNINKSKLVLDGFYVLQATTVDEVFKILQDDPPDAMILEWQETKFNCKGLLAKISQNPANNAIIKVVLSALTDSQVQREILNSGTHKYMAKMDTNPAKLSNVLKQLIEERDGSV
jgi:CheY-like chemotaxis protein/predicted RNA-binding Zn-ribbon protein involved in translation (DUF1610 family)